MARKKLSYASVGYLRNAADFLQELKAYTYELILKDKPRTILDIGCGPGIDTVSLAQKADPKTQIIGVDLDKEMVAKANIWAFSKGVDNSVSHRKASATQLPFDDSTFDVVRSERLFQHLKDPKQKDPSFKESLRVLKPGGLAVFADPDWASVSVDFPNNKMERKMVTFLVDKLITNGYSGRQLFGMFQQAGLQDIQVKIFPFHFHQLELTPFGKYLVKEAQKADLYPAKKLNHWLTTLEEKNKNGSFFCSLNMFVVSGRKAGGD